MTLTKIRRKAFDRKITEICNNLPSDLNIFHQNCSAYVIESNANQQEELDCNFEKASLTGQIDLSTHYKL